ncbi:MAG: hypothetical protein II416_08040 [Prevotella sp.]|nr:hypothetical protein [Prevotella sp.]
MGERRNADRHLIIVAIYAAAPIRGCEMAGENNIHIKPCCYARDINASCRQPKGWLFLYIYLSSHFAVPIGTAA